MISAAGCKEVLQSEKLQQKCARQFWCPVPDVRRSAAVRGALRALAAVPYPAGSR
jgi:hypothetical protein